MRHKKYSARQQTSRLSSVFGGLSLTTLGLSLVVFLALIVTISLPTPAAGQNAQRRLDLYCDKRNQRRAAKAQHRNSSSNRRRSNNANGSPLTFDECMDRLEAWCVRKERRRRNRQPHRDCRALTEIRPDWNEKTNPADKKRRDKQKRQKTKNKQKKQQNRINRRWKTVKPQKAQKVAIKNLNEKFARLALKQSMQADRMRGPGERRRKFPKRNPKAERAVTETEINDAGNYIAADIDVTQEQFQDIVEEVDAEIEGKGRRKRKVGRGLYNLWPKDKPISYHYNANVPPKTRVKIEDAIKLWQENTCVRFQNQGPNTDRLEFVNGAGCSSYVGKVGGTQEVSIRTPGCDYVGIISHEIGHALGFFHEQARPDRDDNVQINMANVEVWYRNNFAKQYAKDVDNQNAPYDYGSVMHYAPYSFAQNSNTPTIFPVVGQERYGTTMGQRQKPSFVDFEQINRAYCSHKCRGSNTVCEHDGYPDPNNCRRCKCPEGFGGDKCETVAFSNQCPGSGILEAYQDAQILETPNYPGRFSRGTECIYLIRTVPGRRVFVQFDGRFDLYCKDVCDENYLEIKNTTSFARTGGRFCCGFKPQDDPISSESSEMLLIMRNNGNHQYRGFSARYWTNANRRGGSGGSTGVTVVPPATTRSTTTTDAPRFTTTIPTGVNIRGCNCRDWSQWTACSQPCGGCGKVSRERRCTGKDPKKCYVKEERICNRETCKCTSSRGCPFINPTGIAFHPQYGLLNKGCCLSAPMERDGKCGPFNIGTLFTFLGGGQEFNLGNIVGGGGSRGNSGGGGFGGLIDSFIGGG